MSEPVVQTTIDKVIDSLKFNSDGLIPAVSQQHDTGEILMMAWMNKDAVAETLRVGRVCYWSRSRRKLWRKGESSGQARSKRCASSVGIAMLPRYCCRSIRKVLPAIPVDTTAFSTPFVIARCKKFQRSKSIPTSFTAKQTHGAYREDKDSGLGDC